MKADYLGLKVEVGSDLENPHYLKMIRLCSCWKEFVFGSFQWRKMVR